MRVLITEKGFEIAIGLTEPSDGSLPVATTRECSLYGWVPEVQKKTRREVDGLTALLESLVECGVDITQETIVHAIARTAEKLGCQMYPEGTRVGPKEELEIDWGEGE